MFFTTSSYLPTILLARPVFLFLEFSQFRVFVVSFNFEAGKGNNFERLLKCHQKEKNALKGLTLPKI